MCTLQIIVYFVSFPDLSDENDKSHTSSRSEVVGLKNGSFSNVVV